MATHSSILARKIPWTEELGGLQSVGSEGVGHNWALKWKKRSRRRNIYRYKECVKRINLSKTMERGEITRGQNPHAIKNKTPEQ